MSYSRPDCRRRNGFARRRTAVGGLFALALVVGAAALSRAQGRSAETLPREVSDREARPVAIAADGAVQWRVVERELAAADASETGAPAPGLSAGTTGRTQAEGRTQSDPPRPALPASLDELVVWGGFVEPRRGPLIITRDGGLLVADLVELTDTALSVDHDQFGERTLPVGQVRAVVLQWPTARAARDRIARRCAEPPRTDGRTEVLLDNGDLLLGRLALKRDGRTELLRGDQSDSVPFDRVAVIRLPARPAEENVRGDTALRRSWVGWADGTCLLVEGLTISGEDVSFRALGGDWNGSPRRLKAIQPVGGRVVYLLDRQPNAFRHIPFLDAPRSYTFGASVTGGWPVCRGRLYPKAIGMHSAARLGFAVDPRAAAFAAAVAIDDTTDGGGSVRVRVFVDGRPQWTGEIIRGGQPPVEVFVRLDGASQLDLVVDFADRADVLDRVLWLDPRWVLRAD